MPAFAIVANHTTSDIDVTIVLKTDAGKSKEISVKGIKQGTGTSEALPIDLEGQPATSFSVRVDKGPHKGSTNEQGRFSIGAFGAVVLEVTQNGYVNFFTETEATKAAKIGA